ncbi:MAG: hypothetical protein LBC77_00095 [Spirochaetaceae bacterium]|jgi:hypothetical protein|nr:hypothetical protein [Spirochaetaceae bacterium]
MAVTDLYSILKDYALKMHSANVEKQPFVDFLVISAKYKARKSSAWRIWTIRPRERFQYELEELVARNLVNVQKTTKDDIIFVPAYYVDCVRELWTASESQPELPFPDGLALQSEIPAEHVRTMEFNTEFQTAIKEPSTEDLPVIKFIMGDKCGLILTIASLIPTRMLESALQKLQHYLSKSNNRQVFYAKIIAKLPNLQHQLDAILAVLANTPSECALKIKEGDVGAFMIWTGFCALLREVHGEIANLQPQNIAILQTAAIIEQYSVYYRDIALKNDESVQLAKIIDDNLNKEPYIYTMKMISAFMHESGDAISNRYSRAGVIAAVKKKTMVSPNSVHLPDVLSFVDSETEKWFVIKIKLYEAFANIKKDAKGVIVKAISTRWHEIIKDYNTEPAMKNQADFEQLVLKTATEASPLLAALYMDGKFVITKEELQHDKNSMDYANTFFDDGALLPLNKIIGLRRDEIIKSINEKLPFWYSVPFLVFILRFFKRRAG